MVSKKRRSVKKTEKKVERKVKKREEKQDVKEIQVGVITVKRIPGVNYPQKVIINRIVEVFNE